MQLCTALILGIKEWCHTCSFPTRHERYPYLDNPKLDMISWIIEPGEMRVAGRNCEGDIMRWCPVINAMSLGAR